jgi:hypothetical protein
LSFSSGLIWTVITLSDMAASKDYLKGERT